ncbi:MAG TPA: hypothetical protein VHC95_09390 [Opitutales bacterium]|nr:hypothetical protein [Opitutales bacterium]
MITWFQRVFGKHFKWVLLLVLGVLLVSFIVSMGAVPRLSVQGGGAGKATMFLGVDMSDQEEMHGLVSAIQFTNQRLYGLQYSDQELERLVEQRIVLMHLADEWHLPEPTVHDMQHFFETVRAFQGPDGRFSNELYVNFKDSVEASPQRDALTAILKEECRLERVRTILAGPGYVPPFLAQSQVALNQIKTDLDVATVDYKSFTPKIELTGDKLTAGLQEIFDKDPTRFPQPAQVNMAYVKFASAPVGEPTAADLQDYVKQHKDAFPKADPAKLSDADKTAVTDAWREAQKAKALDEVKSKGIQFEREYYDIRSQLNPPELKIDAPQFGTLLKKYNAKVQTLPTVVEGKPAKSDAEISNDIQQQVAASLNPAQPTQKAQLPDGVAIFFYLDGVPARASTFAEARDEVLKAYTESEKARQFTALCTTMHDAVVKAMAAGKSFDDAAKAAGFTVKHYTAVTLDDVEKTAMDMPLGEEDKTTPLPDSPLAAMGRDALTALVSSNNTTIPLLLALHKDEPSAALTEGNTGVVFLVTKRAAADVPANSPEIAKMDTAIAQREHVYGAMTVLDSLVQEYKKSVK